MFIRKLEPDVLITIINFEESQKTNYITLLSDSTAPRINANVATKNAPPPATARLPPTARRARTSVTATYACLNAPPASTAKTASVNRVTKPATEVASARLTSSAKAVATSVIKRSSITPSCNAYTNTTTVPKVTF